MIVKITWKAFGNQPQRGRFISSVTFELPMNTANDEAEFGLLNTLYKQTNLYEGNLWTKQIEPLLVANRTHTALSVGDEIEIINDHTNTARVYVCAPLGWRCVQEYEVSTTTPHDREHGWGELVK